MPNPFLFFFYFPLFAMTHKQRSKKTEGCEGFLGSELTHPSKASPVDQQLILFTCNWLAGAWF
jgi:heme-degrading monooxygenase HmoA